MEKCGEVFLSNHVKFIFVCTFCDRQFKDMLEFGEHVHHDHITQNFVELTKPSTFCKLKDKSITQSESTIIKDEYEQCLDDTQLNNYSKHFHNFFEATFYDGATNSNNDDGRGEQENKVLCNENEQFLEPIIKIENENKTKMKGTEKVNESIDPLSDYEQESKFLSDVVVKPIKLRQLNCEFCDRKFKDKSLRARHQRTHTGEKPFPCPHCQKRFASRSHLTDHIFTHTGERPYKCTHCSAAFKHKMNLTVHIRAHLGVKRFACELCGKRFVRNMDRKIHMRSHTGEKPYQCEECGASFSTSGKLTAHKKRHTNTRNHKCEICDKAFYSKYLLKNHLVVHSDARPFQCEICFVTFPRKRALRSHIKIHSDIKEYICTICGKAFAQNAGRYSHMKTHGIKIGQRKDEIS